MTASTSGSERTARPTWANAARFAARPDQVRAARRFVADHLAGHPCGNDAELLASELVTNAITHGGAGEADTVTVTLAATDTLVRISVADHGPQPPCVCRLGPGENWIGEEVTEHGRGLVLLDRLVGGCGGHWGFNRDGRGSAVWFELHADDHPRRIGGPAAYPANAATVDEAAQRASQAARTLDQAYRAWRHTHGLTDPAEISALGYVASLVRLRSADRVLFGIPAHESDVLARFLAVHSEPEGA